MLHVVPLEWTVEEVVPYLERLAVWLRASVLVAFQLTATVALSVLSWWLMPPPVAELCERGRDDDPPPLSHLSLVVPVGCLFLLLRGPSIDRCPRKLPLLLAYCLPHALAFLTLLMCQPSPQAFLGAALLALAVDLGCLGASLLGCDPGASLRRLWLPSVLSLLCATALGLWLLRAAAPFFLGLHATTLLTVTLMLIHDLSLITCQSSFPESFQPSLRLYVENVALFIGMYHLLRLWLWSP